MNFWTLTGSILFQPKPVYHFSLIFTKTRKPCLNQKKQTHLFMGLKAIFFLNPSKNHQTWSSHKPNPTPKKSHVISPVRTEPSGPSSASCKAALNKRCWAGPFGAVRLADRPSELLWPWKEENLQRLPWKTMVKSLFSLFSPPKNLFLGFLAIKNLRFFDCFGHPRWILVFTRVC